MLTPVLSEPSPVADEPSQKIYKVGTLRYTYRSLLVLFGWLLWGDFVFTFFENIFVRFLPLYLNELHASNTLIGLMNGSIAGALNLFLLPSLSQWSDRFRSPWGRRIPFVAVAAPMTVVALILVGFAPEIGAWAHLHLTARFAPALTEATVMLALLCLFIVFFHYSNMVLINTFYWLMREVIPEDAMAQFLAWSRVVSTVSTIAFNWYIFPYILSRRQEVCVGIGLFYLIAFGLMCWKVKEGDYPLPDTQEEKKGFIRQYIAFFKECFSIRLYRFYFYSIILNSMGGVGGSFFLLFYQKTLAIDMETLGKVFTLGSLVSTVVCVPMAWLCQKFSPLRMAILWQAGLTMATIFSFYLLNGTTSLVVFTVIVSVISAGWGLAISTFVMTLFPGTKFAQFYAGTNIVAMATGILANYLVGAFMDAVGSNYRMSILWSAISGLSLIPLFYVYREWKNHGGPDNYIPPLSE